MKISKIYLFSLLLVHFLSGSAFAMEDACDILLTDEEKALACINWRLKNDNLYGKAKKDGHLGDMEKCTELTSKTAPTKKSYFSSDLETFNDTISQTAPYRCAEKKKGEAKWACWGRTSGAKGCYFNPDGETKGVESDEIFFSIGDGTISTKILSFRPSN
jgi:hypothetical protein